MDRRDRKKQEGSITAGVNMSENMGIPVAQNVKDELETNPHSMSSLPEDDAKWEGL